jgi:HD superfamily phosphohydrolase
MVSPKVILEGFVKISRKQVFPSERLVQEVLDRFSPQILEELDSLRTEVQGLRAIKSSEILRLTRLLIDSWTKTSISAAHKLYFDDPVWGHSTIEERLAPLFSHPLVQRLNYIRQLSFAYLVFPSATHTRMSHSLGTCRLIEAALTTVFRNNVIYTENGTEEIDLSPTERQDVILKAKTAALLHDLGHAPFGHALDRLVGFLDPTNPVISPDKHYSVIYLEKYLAKSIPAGLRIADLKAILTHDTERLNSWDTFVSDLIDSSLDVDRMDFLARDAHMSGLLMGFNCAEALIERICPYRIDDQIYLTFHSSCLPYVKDLLFAREKMYLNCYEHQKKLAAERIFTRLIQNLVEENHLSLDEVILLTDDQAMALLGFAALGSQENSSLLHALLQSVDYHLVHEVGLAGGDNTEVGTWKRARDRTGMGRSVYVERPRSWEKEIALAAGLKNESWRVLAVVPDHKTGEPPGLTVQILVANGHTFRAKPLTKVGAKLLTELKNEQKPRSRIRIFADSRLERAQVEAIKAAASDLLGES